MTITQLEAKVSPEKSVILKTVFKKGVQQLSSSIEQTYHVYDRTDDDVWRVNTIWQGRVALRSYLQFVQIPTGILMFREASIEPTPVISEINRQS